jgi:lysophospholipid acyltransferase (LPLAT)-like uncharacterized protein
MRRARRRLGALAIPRLGPPILRFLSNGWKVERLGVENWERSLACPGMLVTLWHGRMAMAIPVGAGANLHVLVSPSGDGQLVPPLLERFGYSWVFGSSNKNPARAVREMLERLKAGGRIVITPDGPRGPRHSTNPGPAWMARETGFPILPVGLVTDRAWRLNSWDAFTIPKRGARVVVNYAEPILVPPDADDDAIDAATREMARRMTAAEEEGFRRLGVAPDW